MKLIGLGQAAAIGIDATVVLLILVPATMARMGHANWWLPGWLDRLLPHLSLEGTPTADAAPSVGAVAAGLEPQQALTVA